jgi:hypothetical protein
MTAMLTLAPGARSNGEPIAAGRVQCVPADAQAPVGAEVGGDKQAQDKQRVIWLAVAPFIALSLFAFVFIVHEELFKGVALLRLNPIEA